MKCLKKPHRPIQPAICNNCKRKCELAGKRRNYKRNYEKDKS
jgi:hypothetical protein